MQIVASPTLDEHAKVRYDCLKFAKGDLHKARELYSFVMGMAELVVFSGGGGGTTTVYPQTTWTNPNQTSVGGLAGVTIAKVSQS